MKTNPLLIAIASCLLVTSAWAQTPAPPADVEMPPDDLAEASADAAPPGIDAPGVYYGDTSGRRYGDEDPDAPACEDSTYNEPEVHGNVRAGVYSGHHVGTGNYEGATVHVIKRLGTCDHPTGEAHISISVDDYDRHGGGYRGPYGH